MSKLEQILGIQEKQLAMWANVLKPEVHQHVVAIITKDNATFTEETAYDVPRGVEIDTIVHRIACGHEVV